MHALVTSAAPADGGVVGWLDSVMSMLGAPGAGAVLAVENVSLIPSEVVLPLAGFAAARGEFSVAAAVVWTTIGTTTGAVVLYLVGMLATPATVRRWITRIPLITDREVDLAESWFDRHGRAAVLLGRMVPIVRSLISIPAGQRRMPFLQFLVLTVLGSAAWNSLFVGAGYVLGARWELVERYAGPVQITLLVIVGVVMVLALVRHRASPARR
ncbi:DedA family protein [Actinomycetospora endophytica]|uniref:DedA family protein n=1 Tax=Actinomycetospora endophytica TaxID=2291215 RepID=A0ABS8PCS8_9PSEU|nr:DedA family protein [Actinomycetospora endophytica]MCD2194799.1 DedA family protein [Actinomycetospora endophytica]